MPHKMLNQLQQEEQFSFASVFNRKIKITKNHQQQQQHPNKTTFLNPKNTSKTPTKIISSSFPLFFLFTILVVVILPSSTNCSSLESSFEGVPSSRIIGYPFISFEENNRGGGGSFEDPNNNYDDIIENKKKTQRQRRLLQQLVANELATTEGEDNDPTYGQSFRGAKRTKDSSTSGFAKMDALKNNMMRALINLRRY
uniref:Uncharacterized protein n=1 Tax=Meloidogyne enterolobii TaxID=390850 RepID=A0A6V7VLN7_MELEN|nr:unnamed protein product [Meloidogyne enterolobii]